MIDIMRSDDFYEGLHIGMIHDIIQKQTIEELRGTIAAQTRWLHVARERRELLEQEIIQLKKGKPEVPALLQPIKGGGSGQTGVA